jgi:hypothetical protein
MIIIDDIMSEIELEISGSGAQAQNGNDVRWNSEEIFAPLCAFFNYKTSGLQT